MTNPIFKRTMELSIRENRELIAENKKLKEENERLYEIVSSLAVRVGEMQKRLDRWESD